MVLTDELEWLDKVDGWSVKHRELEEKCDIVPDRLVEAIKLTTRKYVVPKVEPWELPTIDNMQWELRWDNQIVWLVR